MSAPLKVLASGDVCGRFAAFLKRLETVGKTEGASTRDMV